MTGSGMELFVAARSWSHASWLGSFYPDDLPDDWRLSFYSNEFRAVVVPEVEWVELDSVEGERWVDDTHEEFLFFLEIESPILDWNKSAEFMRGLDHQLGGILIRPRQVESDLTDIAPILVSAAEYASVSLLLPESTQLDNAGETLLKENTVELCWDVGKGEPKWIESNLDSELAVARVVGNKNFTARQWRETIELCSQYGAINHTKSRKVLIMVEDDAPKIQDLRTATLIGDMFSTPSFD